jgi:N-acetylmuramoyl-L-alanine amidase
MKIFWTIALIASLQLLPAFAFAERAQLDSVQFPTVAGNARMVFNLSEVVAKGFFLLNNPARLVIDFKNAKLTDPLAQPPANHPVFSKLRSAERKNTDLRIVVDLKKPITSKDLKITTDKRAGHHVTVNLAGLGNPLSVAKKPVAKKTAPELKTVPAAKLAETDAVGSDNFDSKINMIAAKDKEVVIAIDAGHGGIDAGAHGPNGTQEKKVVFAISKKLERLINKQPGMRAVMVRKGDYYIKLRDRMDIARQAKADLFISIHADAFNDTAIKGASVYTLSNNGASSEAARWLASNENAADLVGGVSLDDKDDVLASVLLDLSQSATKEASRNAAAKILQHFGEVGKLHKNEVQKAAFMVLKSPDIPSILVETAFISNPSEELDLISVVHQEKVATAIFKGIASYFREYAPVGTRMASSQ